MENNNLKDSTTKTVDGEVTIKYVKTPTGVKKIKVIKRVVNKPTTNVSTTNSLPKPEIVVGPDGIKREISYKFVETPTGVKKVKVIKKFIPKQPMPQVASNVEVQPKPTTVVESKETSTPAEVKPVETKQEVQPKVGKEAKVENPKKKSNIKKKVLLGTLLPLALLGAAAYPVYYCVTKYGKFTNLSFDDESKEYVENIRTQHKPKGDLYIYFVALTNLSSSKEGDLHCLTNVRLSLNGSEPQVLHDVVWYENPTASKDFNIKIIIPSDKINSISNTVKVGFDVSRFVIDPSIGSDMQISFIQDGRIMVLSFIPVKGYDPENTKLYNESGYEVPQSSKSIGKTFYEFQKNTGDRACINIHLESMVFLPNCAGALTFKKTANVKES